ncbi:MAG: hypothetical protein B6229_10760 [Spirochaetaceae bacterium 4572_7]|nr:MAG: hypothetical protein B6229_10760 [Spirochaetaceae bacterium 4572_7]
MEIDIPQNSNIWFPLFEHQLLMNTKQCLVRNVIPCKKDLIDDDCLLGCSRSAFLKEKQHLEVAVVKRI